MSLTSIVQDDKVLSIRKQFPILTREVKGKPLVYFDNAATTQKPQRVIDAIDKYYNTYNANVHRGIHTLSEEGTLAMEASRDYIAQFIGCKREEFVFTKGTTESINLVAFGLGECHFEKGDEILISTMEHHANIVPWHMLAERKGLTVKAIPIHDSGELDMEAFKTLLTPKVKLVSVVHTSNSLGTINPVQEIIENAHALNIPVLLDGAQALSHSELDVKKLDVDFMSFSAHKAYGPTGIGGLYAKQEWLEKIPPYQGGGEMIAEVTLEKTVYNELPYKFEAGTPHIEGAIVMSEGLKYIKEVGFDFIQTHEKLLLDYATEKLHGIDGLRIIGEAKNKASVVSFVVDGVHHQDLALMLDTRGVAVRTGHHCTQPLMQRFGIKGTTRASFAVYNTLGEIDVFIEALEKSIKLLR